MKKLFALLLALCLMCSACALADQEIKANTPEVDVYVMTYVDEGARYENGFTVYIPDSIDIRTGTLSQTVNVSMDIYNTDWRGGTKLQVLLAHADSFDYGYDEENDTFWRQLFLNYTGEREDGDWRGYDIPYSIYFEDGRKLMPWNFEMRDEDNERIENGVWFDDNGDGQIFKYIWNGGDYGERRQSADLTFRLEPGDGEYKGGEYGDRLTFSVNFGESDCGELYHEANGIKIPAPAYDEHGEVYVDSNGNQYYRLWGEEYGEFGTYFDLGTETEADMTGITELHVKFKDWDDVLIADGDWVTIDDENDPNYGLTFYNDFVNGDYSVFPADRYMELNPTGDLTGNWLNELSFDPNSADWPW